MRHFDWTLAICLGPSLDSALYSIVKYAGKSAGSHKDTHITQSRRHHISIHLAFADIMLCYYIQCLSMYIFTMKSCDRLVGTAYSFPLKEGGR